MSAQHLHHWCDGGNAVTNFSPEQTFIYARAIDEHGDSALYIGPPTPKGCLGDRALRVRGPMKDLSEFWGVFDRVQKDTSSMLGGQS